MHTAHPPVHASLGSQENVLIQDSSPKFPPCNCLKKPVNSLNYISIWRTDLC